MAKNLRLPISDLAPGQRELPAAAARYLLRVHRLRAGDQLVVFDPEQGVEADARLVSTSATAVCEVSELRPGRRPGMADLCLVQCLGKGDKAEQVIRDATALGVGRIRLVESERSVSRLTDKAPQKRARYESVALSAARQCLRSDVPVIEPLRRLEDHLSAPLTGVHWVLHPAAESGLTQTLREFSGVECTLWIGPEGGFAPQELAGLVSAGATLQHLGEWVLRTETAATVALALLSARVRDNKPR